MIEQELSFAELFEQQCSNTKNESLTPGTLIKGTVISVGKDAAFINLDTKIDGIVTLEDLQNATPPMEVTVGDEVELYVINVSSHEIRLAPHFSSRGAGFETIEKAFYSNIPIEGKIIAVKKGGFDVLISGKNAFCPLSQIDTNFVDNPEKYLQQVFTFRISKFEQNGKNIVVSRRALLEEEKKEIIKEFLAEYKVGDEITGEVIRITPFGAFVQIANCLEGLVHISEISWENVKNIGDFLEIGQKVTTKILNIELHEKKGLQISLSIRKTLANPWSENFSFKEGQSVTGTVSKIVPFGAFVDLGQGFSGLIHLSEMSYTKNVTKATDVLEIGDELTIKIISINIENQRISLSLRDALGNPWDTFESKYSKGSEVSATLQKKTSFGFFMEIEPGIVGLTPFTLVKDSESFKLFESAEVGTVFPLIIEDIDVNEKKVTLLPADCAQGNKTQNANTSTNASANDSFTNTLEAQLKNVANPEK